MDNVRSRSETRRIFLKSLLHYKLQASGGTVLVPYYKFSWRETKNTWPILWTAILILLINIGILLFCVGIFTKGISPLNPHTQPDPQDKGPFVFSYLVLLFAIMTTYKFGRAIRTLWVMARDGQFDEGFPEKIDAKA